MLPGCLDVKMMVNSLILLLEQFNCPLLSIDTLGLALLLVDSMCVIKLRHQAPVLLALETFWTMVNWQPLATSYHPSWSLRCDFNV
jgi:hypothetical protein